MTDARSGAKVALVTGTSSGMGLHAAVQLAQAGCVVVATMRDVAKADALRAAAAEAGVDVDIRTLDVTDPQAITATVDAVIADHGHLDILVNNAGRGCASTLEQLSDQVLQEQLDVNYLGVARMTRDVLPHLRERGSGRVVTVTSVGGAVGQPFADAYCGAKFAVEGLMQSLAPVMAQFGVEISVVEPGAVATEFIANVERGDVVGSASDPSSIDAGPYTDALNAYLRRSSATFAAAQTATDAARTIVEAATTPDWKFRWQTSEVANAFVSTSLADLTGEKVFAMTSSWIAKQ